MDRASLSRHLQLSMIRRLDSLPIHASVNMIRELILYSAYVVTQAVAAQPLV
jgi:hypothetical protein